MSEQVSGLGVDPTKTPVYSTTEDQQQKYNDALQATVTSLENRYANPNWFKVAAGFLKPQLGGFAASLGSASEALGENVEKQRESALPIAQMRAQLAQSEMVLGSNKTQSDEFKAWQASGKPMDKTTYARLTALNPASQIAAAAKAAYEGESKDVENSRAQQRMVMDSIGIKQAKGIPLSTSETNFLQNFASGVLGAPETARASTMAQPKPDDAAIQRAQRDVTSVTYELSHLPANDPRRAILNVELEKAKKQAGGEGAMTAEEPVKSAEKPAESKYYPMSHPVPDVSTVTSDPQRSSILKSYEEGAKADEDTYVKKLQQYGNLAVGPTYTTVKNNNDTAVRMIEGNKDAAAAVFNIIRKGGPLVAALDAGIGVHAGSFNANVSLPTQAWINAGLPPQYQTYADKIMSLMVRNANASLASQGITPANSTGGEYMAALRAAAGIGQTPEAALNILHHSKVDFDHNKESFDTIKNELTHKANPHSLTKVYDIFHYSPRIKEIDDKYGKIHNFYDTQLEKQTTRTAR
jgi:hypothetical protein